tara:strand:- start:454 stop:1293 length:840 start_codon:yes stop_codon:yes gene_type:complete
MLMNSVTKQPQLLIGKSMTGKTTRAINELGGNPIILYANEIPTDIYSLPKENGLLIEDIHHKANVNAILEIIRTYQGDIFITSLNQKDVPKKIKDRCKMRRQTGNIGREEILKIAPNSDKPDDVHKDMYTMMRNFVNNKDRDYVAEMFKINKPPITQLMHWLNVNINVNKLAFIDGHIKWRWPSQYLYELVAYCDKGKGYSVNSPKRGKYTDMIKICRKLKLKDKELYLLEDLLEDAEFREFAKSKLSHQHWRMLGYGEKKMRTNKTYTNNYTKTLEDY